MPRSKREWLVPSSERPFAQRRFSDQAGFFILLSAAAVFWFLSPFLAPSSVAAAADTGRSADDVNDVLVLQNVTIESMSAGGTQVGSIVIRDGEIVAVGESPDIPDGAEVIDLTGHTAIPGLIDSRSSMWLTPAARRESSTRAGLDVVDGIDSYQEDWREVARQGVTSVYVQPTEQSRLGGIGAVLSVAPADGVRNSIVVRPAAGLQATIGLTGATSRDRFNQFNQLRTSLERVRRGQEARAEEPEEEEDEPEAQRGRRGGPEPPPGRGRGRGQFQAAPQTRSITQPNRTTELLEQVLEKSLPLRVEVHHADALGWLLSLADEFDITLIIEGASEITELNRSASLEGPRVTLLDQILESNQPLTVGPVIEFGSVPGYRRDADLSWLGQLPAGHPWSLGSFADDPRGSRLLRTQAAAAIAQGVDRMEALRAVTINPARLMRVSDQIGSIEVGKRADIAVFADDPLDPSVPATLVLNRGRVVHQMETQLVAEQQSAIVDSAELDLPARLPDTFAVTSDRVLIDGEFNRATLVVRDGVIEQFGESVEVPEDVLHLDLGSAVITPGLVVGHSHVGQRQAVQETAESDASHYRAIDAFDPTSSTARSMLRGGFMHIGFAPSPSVTASGMVGQAHLGNRQHVIAPEIANQYVLHNSARSNQRYPASLSAQVAMLQSMFDGQIPDTRLYVSSAVERALMTEKQRVVDAVLSGSRPAIFRVDADREIESALELMSAFEMTGALLASHRIVDHLEAVQRLDAGWIVAEISGNEYDLVFDRMAQVASAGVPIAWSGESAERLRLTAALGVNAGVPREVALRALTGGGATLVGMEQQAGELVEGGRADFVIWSGSPLNRAAQPLRVFVDGELIQ